MSEYKLKSGKIGNGIEEAYENVENKFKEKFLEKDKNSESGYMLKAGKAAESVTKSYKNVEDSVVGIYKKIEDTVVENYKKVEQKFVDTFLEKVEEEKEGEEKQG